MLKKFRVASTAYLVAAVVSFSSVSAPFAYAANWKPELANSTILIIRHAEKPAKGDGLTPQGQARAEAYVKYFEPFNDGEQSFNVDALYATSNTSRSARPQLTLTPLSKATGIPVDTRYGNYDVEFLVQALRKQKHGKHVLIAWHHGHIPELLNALGANAAALLPNGKWPAEVYDWVVELKFDKDSKLIASKRIQENLQ